MENKIVIKYLIKLLLKEIKKYHTILMNEHQMSKDDKKTLDLILEINDIENLYRDIEQNKKLYK